MFLINIVIFVDEKSAATFRNRWITPIAMDRIASLERNKNKQDGR